ncbi:ABC transporter [Streptomyces sp. P17]|uniref:ABC transporter n=1 Tax=Streptomyces sp. P17 TaxID=3074716 RepID=UPI0028F41D59|nr:ABC transporter [Streptomyces sp. P17]MDT9698728.1 ABC transporter [Streptomyces sp. P17]
MRGVIRYAGRTLPRRALGAGAAVGLLIAGTSRLLEDAFSPWLALNALRAAALSFALGLAFLLDDPARHTTATVPTRRPVRQALRLALVAPFAALWWTAAVLLVPSELRPPVGAVTLEAGAACALALAGAAVAIRRSDEPEPGVSAAAGLLTVAVLAMLLQPWDLFVTVDDPRWADAHQQWGVVLTAALAGCAMWTREPARPQGRGPYRFAAPPRGRDQPRRRRG